MSSVVIVGSYNHDHVWNVDALPAPGATRLARYAGGPGGKGFNQAVAAARAGADTVFIAALGAEAFSLLLDRMDDQQAPERRIVQPQLVVRDSTARAGVRGTSARAGAPRAS